MNDELFVDWSPDSRDYAALLQRLASANVASGGPSGYRSIAVISRDPDTGEAASGVWGVMLYGWLLIELLYVAEPDRRKGLGSRLLATVENAARERDCAGAWLSTYAFQAPGFYEKNGYERFAGLGSAPASHSAPDHRIYLYRKSFRG